MIGRWSMCANAERKVRSTPCKPSDRHCPSLSAPAHAAGIGRDKVILWLRATSYRLFYLGESRDPRAPARGSMDGPRPAGGVFTNGRAMPMVASGVARCARGDSRGSWSVARGVRMVREPQQNQKLTSPEYLLGRVQARERTWSDLTAIPIVACACLF